MEVSKIRLLEFLNQNGPQYVIPVYQRNYTWNETNVKKLLDDIYNILIGKTSAHFLGNFIYIITATRNIVQERSVVDGQQRLTTVFLILHALRDISYEQNNDDDANNIQTIYLTNKVSSQERDFTKKLKPLVNDDDIYAKIADKKFDEIKSSKSLVYRNYIFIKGQIIEWLKSYTINEIIEAMNKVIIVWVQLEKDEDAQQIFESINTTGEPLKAFELIRNFILMNKSDVDQMKLYNDYWLQIEKQFKVKDNYIESKNIEEFFRFYLASKLYILCNKNELYKSFKEFWIKQVETQKESNILDDIVSYAKYYSILLIDSKGNNFLNKEIQIFRRINSNIPTPFLMGIFDLYEKKIIENDKMKDILSIVNTYMIRRSIIKLNGNTASRIFPTLLKNVKYKCDSHGYTNIVDMVKFYLSNANKQKSVNLPSDDQITAFLQTNNVYPIEQIRTFFYVLETQNPIEIDVDALTVEHILPQTMTEYWLNAVGGDKDTYELYIGRLGNLTLADKSTNSEISNKNFIVKKTALKNVGRINMSNDIYNKSTWGCEEIDERTDYLITRFLKLFPFFQSAVNYDSQVSYKIKLMRNEVEATALLLEDQSIILKKDSKFKKCTNRKSNLTFSLNNYIKNGQIKETDNFYILETDIPFSSISTVTNFLCGGSNNGWISWEDENNVIINDSLRSKILGNL